MESDNQVLVYDVSDNEEESSDDADYLGAGTPSVLQVIESKAEEFPFEILSTEQIAQYMIEFVKEVNVVMRIPATITRILLNHFNWDKQKLMEKYYDGDREKLFAEARIVDHMKIYNDTCIESLQNSSADTAEDCGVCFIPRPQSVMANLSCGHRFCLDCWNNYLKMKIMDEGVGQAIACAAYKCEILVDDAIVMKLVKDPQVKLKYQRLITNSFVERNKLLRWCSTPGCEVAIKVRYPDVKAVTCSKCNATMCFACGENWHDPITCQLLREWIKQCDKDSENVKWITKNTRDCPQCHASIEKTGGCNHICCQKCKHEFCWTCTNPWSIHPTGWYRCNKYNVNKQNVKNADPRNPLKSLQRYLFYHYRFMTHQASLKLEYKLYNKVNAKMEEIQQQSMTWFEGQFLKKAVDVLRSCRQTLMYTYAFAYYLKKTNQTAIFEDNQKDLEFAVETLSGYLERDTAGKTLTQIKLTVVDKTSYCESRIKALLRHVHEGYDQDWWEYVD